MAFRLAALYGTFRLLDTIYMKYVHLILLSNFIKNIQTLTIHSDKAYPAAARYDGIFRL